MKKLLDMPGLRLSLDEIKAMSAKEIQDNIDLVNASLRLEEAPPIKIETLDDVKKLSHAEVVINLDKVNQIISHSLV